MLRTSIIVAATALGTLSACVADEHATDLSHSGAGGAAIDGGGSGDGGGAGDSDATSIGGSSGSGDAGEACSAVFGVTCAEFEKADLKGSNTSPSDAFGTSVALSGDTLAVGAVFEGRGDAYRSGAVYVFVRNGSVWSQQAYLKASNAGTNDNFGGSVALSGDTLAVGARGEASAAAGVNGNQASNDAPASGAAYVFVRSGGIWSQQAYLKASNPEGGTFMGGGDYFGDSVALSEDTLAVGAPGEGSAATGVNGDEGSNDARSSGAVYVFMRSGGVWSQQVYLKASNTGEGDAFGGSVALSGDSLAVGAPGEASAATGVNGNQASNDAPGSGAVYVFVRSGAVWNQQTYLKASNTGAEDGFGDSLALSGDTLAVGASREDGAATGVNGNQASNDAGSSGAAYVFVRTGGVWSQQAYLKASNTGAEDGFGDSLALSGDTLVVGASREDGAATGINGNQASNNAHDSGAAYVFVRSGGAWGQQAYLKASNTGTGDRFAFSVALSGNTLAAGAWFEQWGGTVYVRRIGP